MTTQTTGQSDSLDLLEKILQGTNTVSMTLPTILGLIATIRKGREEGKSDDEIQEESMSIALRTKGKAEQQMSDQP